MGGPPAPLVPPPSTGRTRLHITPFNADLLDRFMPQGIKSQATNISFHTIQTFPERGFGFVELPEMEAQKLKKKFSGTTLRGAKVRIEDAKPEKSSKSKKRKSAATEGEADAGAEKGRKKIKVERAKRGEGIIPGHELEEGRRVKRGWEADAASKKTGKDSGNNDKGGLKGKKNLFKTSVPPNALPIDPKTSQTKADSRQRQSSTSRKKSIVVKEFKKASRVPNVGKAAKQAPALRYEDGLGWVDEEGTIIEPESASTKRRRIASPFQPDRSLSAASRPSQGASEKMSSLHSKQEPSPRLVSASEVGPTNEQRLSSAEEDEEEEEESSAVSSEEVSSDTDTSGDEESEDDESQAESPKSNEPARSITPVRSMMHPGPNATDSAMPKPSPESDAGGAVTKEVHPLEALFKRPAPKSSEDKKPQQLAPIDTSFSFFASTDEVDEDSDNINPPPQTPHTKRDLELRNIRSAAPTPDTAAIGKRFEFPFGGDDEDSDDSPDDEVDEAIDEEDDFHEPAAETDRHAQQRTANAEESEFRKWFYENRGDLNRSWKKRRREEKKLQRQRESRRLGRKLA